MDLAHALRQVRIVPVIVIEDLSVAIPLARALVEGGLNVLEVTLRTPVAYEAIRLIGGEIVEAMVGAGTVLNHDNVEKSKAAGAKFVVSPGLVEEVVVAASDQEIPVLPGVASASDIMRGLNLGLTLFKFFPAESLGGVNTLKALSGPFPQVRFCPTGGISRQNLASYLRLVNVVAAGGSWMVPADLINARDFSGITPLAKEAVAIVKAL
jgi:2-dehydro-3-deoxyphosphogluconate aldolase/(4S)-4-hydroxy-2-oxoglutarate aldolase